MSEEFQRKLRVHLAVKHLPELLARVDGLQFIGFVDDAEWMIASSTFADVYRINAQPFARLAIDTPQEELVGWLRACVRRAGIQDLCYLKVHEFRDAPWAKVHVSASEDWLFAVWNCLTNRELVILSATQTTVLVLSEEEHYYEAHLRQLNLSLRSSCARTLA